MDKGISQHKRMAMGEKITGQKLKKGGSVVTVTKVVSGKLPQVQPTSSDAASEKGGKNFKRGGKAGKCSGGSVK